MDLTKAYPRSVREQLFGVVQVLRAIDKGKALAAGTIGDYAFNCPMDQRLFGFLGVDHEALLNVIKNARTDSEIESYFKSYIDKKSSEEIERFNAEFLGAKPQDEEMLEYFNTMRAEVAPDRMDITTWVDLLDLDEKRAVPIRQTVNA